MGREASPRRLRGEPFGAALIPYAALHLGEGTLQWHATGQRIRVRGDSAHQRPSLRPEPPPPQPAQKRLFRNPLY